MTCEEARRDRSSDLGNAPWHQDNDCDDIGDHDDPLILGMVPSTKMMIVMKLVVIDAEDGGDNAVVVGGGSWECSLALRS